MRNDERREASGETEAFRIRPATPSDAAGLARFAASIFRDTYAATTAPADLDTHVAEFFTPAAMGAEIADPAIRTLLAVVGDAVVGYAQTRRGPAPPCAYGADSAPRVAGPSSALEIMRFYVARRWRGRGIAPRLMQSCLATAGPSDWPIWLGVYMHNDRAIAFYAKCGFRAVGRKTYLLGADPQDDDVMVWTHSTSYGNTAMEAAPV